MKPGVVGTLSVVQSERLLALLSCRKPKNKEGKDCHKFILHFENARSIDFGY
jgi:hypothetical protein